MALLKGIQPGPRGLLASLEKTPEIVFEDLDLKIAILLPQYNTFRKVG